MISQIERQILDVKKQLEKAATLEQKQHYERLLGFYEAQRDKLKTRAK